MSAEWVSPWLVDGHVLPASLCGLSLVCVSMSEFPLLTRTLVIMG